MTTVQTQPIAWLRDLDEALRRAQSERKFVLLDFFAPG